MAFTRFPPLLLPFSPFLPLLLFRTLSLGWVRVWLNWIVHRPPTADRPVDAVSLGNFRAILGTTSESPGPWVRLCEWQVARLRVIGLNGLCLAGGRPRSRQVGPRPACETTK